LGPRRGWGRGALILKATNTYLYVKTYHQIKPTPDPTPLPGNYFYVVF